MGESFPIFLSSFLSYNGLVCDAFLVSCSDEYLSEFVSSGENRLLSLTGFTGSSGTALFLPGNRKFYLFTDGRYFTQAKLQCGEFMEVEDAANLLERIALICAEFGISSITLDGRLHSFAFISKLEARLSGNGIGLNFAKLDVKDPVDTGSAPGNVIPFELSSESTGEKLLRIRDFMSQRSADAMYVFNPCEVAWVLNFRLDFVLEDSRNPAPKVSCVLWKSGDTLDYALVKMADIGGIASVVSCQISKILISGNFISYFAHAELLAAFGEGSVVFDETSYISKLKSVKGEFELECFRGALRADDIAVSNFISWCKRSYGYIKGGLTEVDLTRKLEELRAADSAFMGNSFDTICGSGAKSAIIHYNPLDSLDVQIDSSGSGVILLIDSGGQYYDVARRIAGTTDITRTILLGKADAKWIFLYTLVLKGHIAVARAVFPRGTTGASIDSFARQYLWNHGYNYAHGTGHGVGYLLSVHEGPAGISPRSGSSTLESGMVLSNEPGVYLPGEFGIRLENLVVVRDHESLDGFLCFETLTKVRFEPELIDWNLLNDEEISWLVEYENGCCEIDKFVWL